MEPMESPLHRFITGINIMMVDGKMYVSFFIIYLVYAPIVFPIEQHD